MNSDVVTAIALVILVFVALYIGYGEGKRAGRAEAPATQSNGIWKTVDIYTSQTSKMITEELVVPAEEITITVKGKNIVLHRKTFEHKGE